MSELNMKKIPSYLETPPQPSEVLSVPTTKLQELPFEKIRWQAFEKLCLRLARNNSEVEFCRFYGKRGDEQKGIDLYARSYESEKYIVYQCKLSASLFFGAALAGGLTAVILCGLYWPTIRSLLG